MFLFLMDDPKDNTRPHPQYFTHGAEFYNLFPSGHSYEVLTILPLYLLTNMKGE